MSDLNKNKGSVIRAFNYLLLIFGIIFASWLTFQIIVNQDDNQRFFVGLLIFTCTGILYDINQILKGGKKIVNEK